MSLQRWSCDFAFYCVMLYFTFTGLYILNHHCISGINQAWSWWMIFLMYCEFGLCVLCWKLLPLYLSEMLGCNFLCIQVFFGLDIILRLSLLNEPESVSLFSFIERVWEIVALILSLLGRIHPGKSSAPRLFLLSRFDIIYLLPIVLFKFSIISWFNLG